MIWLLLGNVWFENGKKEEVIKERKGASLVFCLFSLFLSFSPMVMSLHPPTRSKRVFFMQRAQCAEKQLGPISHCLLSSLFPPTQPPNNPSNKHSLASTLSHLLTSHGLVGMATMVCTTSIHLLHPSTLLSSLLTSFTPFLVSILKSWAVRVRKRKYFLGSISLSLRVSPIHSNPWQKRKATTV